MWLLWLMLWLDSSVLRVLLLRNVLLLVRILLLGMLMVLGMWLVIVFMGLILLWKCFGMCVLSSVILFVLVCCVVRVSCCLVYKLLCSIVIFLSCGLIWLVLMLLFVDCYVGKLLFRMCIFVILVVVNIYYVCVELVWF